MNDDQQSRAVSLSDLAELTLRANVAFAVRCAHRVRSCFQLPDDAENRLEHLTAVDAAIRVATSFCRGLELEPGRAVAAVRAAHVAADTHCENTNFAGFAAVRAAQAAVYAEEVVRNATDSSITEVVAAAFGAGRVVAANAGMMALNQVVAALYADLQNLRKVGRGAASSLGAAIDPSEAGPLGPLWPDGVPLGFA
jgi:hypothetical protein